MVFGTVVRRCSIGRIPLIKFRHGAITSVDRSTTQNLQASNAPKNVNLYFQQYQWLYKNIKLQKYMFTMY